MYRVMLTNFDLEGMAEKDDLDLIGVFSKDKLPTKRIAGDYIINLQDYEDGGGTHWVAFKIFDNKKCCYFDPFGFGCPVDVKEFLTPFRPISYNNRVIQDLKSELCGYFCLAFLKYFKDFNSKNDVYEAYDDFLNSFSINTKTNDKIVMEMLKK
jgi:hypothetical protein